MIFVDSNIPMYLVGADHPNKDAAQRLLETHISTRDALVTDAEVLQEILHRYQAIGRLAAIQPAFDAVLDVVDEVFGIELSHVQRAKAIMTGASGLSARDALHVAVMESHDVTRIMTFDRGFDARPGLQRLG